MLRDQLIIGTALFVPLALLFRVALSMSTEYRARMRVARTQGLVDATETHPAHAGDASHPLRKSA
jgi:hypothetical protein